MSVQWSTMWGHQEPPESLCGGSCDRPIRERENQSDTHMASHNAPLFFGFRPWQAGKALLPNERVLGTRNQSSPVLRLSYSSVW